MPGLWQNDREFEYKKTYEIQPEAKKGECPKRIRPNKSKVKQKNKNFTVKTKLGMLNPLAFLCSAPTALRAFRKAIMYCI